MSDRTRPNILWICTDQQRYDTVGALNNPHIRTPNLDALCAQGVAFTHAFCQSPICTPSRASFMTGLYPGAVHCPRNGNAHFPENERVQLITHRLAQAGYDGGLAGKLHLASPYYKEEARAQDGYRAFHYSHASLQENLDDNQYHTWLREQGVDFAAVFKDGKGQGQGYRADMDPRYHQTTWCAERTIDFIREAPDRGQPWFFSVHPFDPHPPFDGPDVYTKRYDPAKVPAPIWDDNDPAVQARLDTHYFQNSCKKPGLEAGQRTANYYGMVELIDEQVGRMLTALDETGQRENTVVIFMSDHGEMLGDHGLVAKGCRFYEGLVRVPLIVSWPARFKQGLVSPALVELVDLAPTLAELCGVDLPWTHGKSLTPILNGAAVSSTHREFVRCEFYDALGAAPEPTFGTMYRTARHKLNTYHGNAYGELYDLEDDPNEVHNLWEDPAHAALKSDLMRRSFDATVVHGDLGPERIGRY